jgi:hypothetical protein
MPPDTKFQPEAIMTLNPSLQRIALIVNATRGELTRIGEQHSCIFAGAVLTEVLHQCGFPRAYPLTIRAFIANPILAQWMRNNSFADESKEPEWRAIGGKMIVLGVGSEAETPPGHWAGHLGVVVPDQIPGRHALLDLSVTQASLPEFGINLVPMIVMVPDTFVKGQTDFNAAPNGSLVSYKAFPDDHSYSGFPIWTDKAIQAQAVKRILAELPSR